MTEFYVSLSREEIASQIASLINRYNKLYRKYSRNKILYNNNTNYFVEIVHNIVVGCVGALKKSHNVTEIKHICVNPAYRRKGIAKKLVNLAIANCDTEFVYMTIRHDNEASLTMAKSLGFVPIKQHWSVDHFVITLGRIKNHGNWWTSNRQQA
jgi:RimJ/RimL family protein N-acetyltransferase